jgi:hypothetical protein
MNGRKEWLILPALIGMDLSWLYGWASLVMLGSFNQPFPFMTAFGIAGPATLLTLSHHRRGWRIYQIAGAHLAGLTLACAAIIYGVEDPGRSFFEMSWVAEFFTISKTPIHWLELVVALFWCLAFWIMGTRLALLPKNHLTVSNHFDFGVISLVLLHLLEMLLFVEGGIILTELSLPRVLFAFFIFSVTAFCLARCAGQGKSDFITGFRGIGVIFSFLALFLLLGSGITALFLPYLTMAAQTGVAILHTVTAPAGELLLRILLFLFGHDRLLPESAASSSAQNPQFQAFAEQPVEGWLALLQKIFLLLTASLGVLLAFAFCVLLIWQLGWWLSKRSDTTEPGPSPWQLLRKLLQKIGAAFIMPWRKLQGTGKRSRSPVQLYLSLINWGALSGMPLILSETPREYGGRLSKRLPAATQEIDLIISVHNASIYGGRTDQGAKLPQLQCAWSAYSRLRSPRFWPARMKALLFR